MSDPCDQPSLPRAERSPYLSANSVAHMYAMGCAGPPNLQDNSGSNSAQRSSGNLSDQGRRMTISDQISNNNRRRDIPDDLTCFLQKQNQRQARMETTMRSFPSCSDQETEKPDLKRKRTNHEDPLSHKIIEKRRRDRMNSCLADLSRLIPSTYSKKGRGRIEKTEIIELAIKHMKHLQNHTCPNQENSTVATEPETGVVNKSASLESFRVGYQECLTEIMHFLVEKEGLYSGDGFCVRLLTHLQKHYDNLGRASTSELHNSSDKTWSGTNLPSSNAREVQKDEDLENSENSEESGYSSNKPDEVVNLSMNSSEEKSYQPYKNEHGGRGYQNEHDDSARGYQNKNGGEKMEDRRMSESENGIMKKDNQRNAFHQRSEERSLISGQGLEERRRTVEEEIRSQRGICGIESEYKSLPEHMDTRLRTGSGIDTPCPKMTMDSMDWEQPNDLSRKGRESESQNGAYRQSYKHKSTLLHNFNQAERECRERLQKRREDRAHAETKPESYSTSHTEERSYHVQVKPDPELLAHPSSTSHMSTFTAEPAKALPSQSIPIFALNSNGSYYVPMSVDISVIHPYMNLYKEETCPILHPVTISVNFQPAHIERSASKPNLGVIHQQQSVIKHWRDQPCL